MTRTDYTDLLILALGEHLDAGMSLHGFSRAATCMEYHREVEAGTQFVCIHFDYLPRYEPGASGRILPKLKLVYPEINRLALEMVAGNVELLGEPEITLWQPVDLLLPKEQYESWCTFGEQTFGEAVRAMSLAFEERLIPFLDEFSSIASIASLAERMDSRVLNQREFYIRITAALLLLQRTADAMKLLEVTFRRPGAKRDFARAFEFVEHRLRS